MYKNKSLCLYYPNDYLEHVPLYKSLAWTSEWLVKYEFFEKYRVWIRK
ncbi:hypothetical protein [Apibacter adventoris]|nr:hypothetical protein [Apibacter adventoris]